MERKYPNRRFTTRAKAGKMNQRDETSIVFIMGAGRGADNSMTGDREKRVLRGRCGEQADTGTIFKHNL